MESWKSIRLELAIFLILFITYSYFHQGGGWANNSRFAQVRSVVEERKFEINHYMIYRFVRDVDGKPRLRRMAFPSGIEKEQIAWIANTGDFSLFQERLYPNKPPGPVLAAVPAYFTAYHFERALGIDPGDWWPLTFNAYLTTAFSVSLLAALGGVVFYRISLQLFPSAPAWTHAASTLTFGMGTLMLPFATTLSDHDIVAALTLLGFWLVLIEKDGGSTLVRPAIALVAAGILIGLIVLMSYACVISVALLTLYVAWSVRAWREVVFFLAGVALPIVLLAWYHMFCFGSVWANASTFQNELFQEKEMLFGMFGIPQFDVIIKLLFSTYRGLFFTSPVLALSCFGFWLMATHYKKHAEVALFVAMFIGFLLMNSSFNNWHSGWSIGPRYLIPALPFLSLPLTLIFEKLPRATLVVAALSATIMLMVTAVDPQPSWMIQNPLIQYNLPLLRGKTLVLRKIDGSPLMPLIQGPVSANPIGVYESWVYPVSQPGSIQEQWNSFNLGEFYWPGSLMSLMPLVCVLILGLGILWRWCRRSTPGSQGALIVSR